MRSGARIAAAAEVLEDIFVNHRPAAVALNDWGRTHRFAGSGDRAAIGNLVYDALRRRLSLAAQMDADTPRALALAAAPRALGLSATEVAEVVDDGSPHALGRLTDDERLGLTRGLPEEAPLSVLADVPVELAPSIERVFGSRTVAEMQAMAARAPVGLRVNTLKSTRERVSKALHRFAPQPTRLAPHGLVIAPPVGAQRPANVEAEPAHGQGWFEVQDEGSQVAAALTGAGPRMQVLDLCAGAGGKTLALGAMLENTGQIYAYDRDPAQLRPIFDRLKRAGVRNVQTVTPGDEAALGALGPRFDVVLVDAPCTGSGTWRRRPDSKWRVSSANLESRIAGQRAVLTLGSGLVRPGGRLVYVTCSVLPEENVDQAAWFLAAHTDYRVLPYADAWRASLGGEPPASADGSDAYLLLTPASHDTDGFFVASFVRAGGK